MRTHLSSSVTFFLSNESGRARGTPRHSTSDAAAAAASATGLHRCFNPAFFRPSHCRHSGFGSVRGEKMRPPHTSDDIQSKTLWPEHASSWRLPEVLGSPQRPSIRASRSNGQSLFTACARRRSGEAWKEPTHLTLGSHKDTRLRYGGSTRLTRPKPMDLGGYHCPPWPNKTHAPAGRARRSRC